MLIINFTNLALPSLSAFVTDSSSCLGDLFFLPGDAGGSSELAWLFPDPEEVLGQTLGMLAGGLH